LRAVGVI